jgi:hypothetical protein
MHVNLVRFNTVHQAVGAVIWIYLGNFELLRNCQLHDFLSEGSRASMGTLGMYDMRIANDFFFFF